MNIHFDVQEVKLTKFGNWLNFGRGGDKKERVEDDPLRLLAWIQKVREGGT